jgi:SsrA-binding protein
VARKDDGTTLVASNRKARHDYLIEDTYEAGLVLMGTEVKALRMGRASLVDGWAGFDDDGELWLQGVHIPEYVSGTWTNHTPRRKRKLLLHRRELDKTVVPLKLYFRDGRAKVEIAVVKGKKAYDKRHALREQQDRREADRAIAARRRGEG